MDKKQEIQFHTVSQTIVLHLLPGALGVGFFFLTGPLLMKIGYPPIMALMLEILFILIPFQLGYLLYQGWRRNGKLSLKGIVLYREPIPLRLYFILVPLLIAWSFAAFVALSPLADYLVRTLFAWFPAWAIPAGYLAEMAQYPDQALLVLFFVILILNGIAAPVVEELYFRGYLLPRIPSKRVWAPLINVSLFSLYHFFSPWEIVSRIVAGIPTVYVVSWKRNIYIGILEHCLLNILGLLLTVLFIYFA